MLLAAEARKHRALREVPVTLVLALVYFILNAEPQNPVQDQRTLWFLTQQDIRAGVGTGVAFLTAVGLPRLVTCERELGTGELIRSSRRGAAYTFGAKLGYAAIYCLLSVLLGMVFGLGVSGSGFGFEGAFEPVEEALYHARRSLPHKHYVYSRLPEGHDPLYLLCVDTLSMVETLRAEIAAFQEEAGVYTVVRPDAGRTGYALLEIYASAATRPAAVEELKKRTGTQAVVAFGDSERDLAMLEAADLSRAVAGADEVVKEAAGKVLPTGDEALAREVDRLFHQSKNRRKNSTKQWKNNIGNIKKK